MSRIRKRSRRKREREKRNRPKMKKTNKKTIRKRFAKSRDPRECRILNVGRDDNGSVAGVVATPSVIFPGTIKFHIMKKTRV